MKLNHILLISTLTLVLSLSGLFFISGCGSSGSLNETSVITLSADSESIPADGKSSVSITAALSNSGNAPVTKYTNVLFKTNLGTFRNGSQTIKVDIIDTSGTATTSLISTTEPGIAEVTCESSGLTQSMKIYFTHYDNSGLPVAEAFDLSVQYHNISGLWMSGIADNIYADLADAEGNAVQDGVPVSFKTYNTGGFLDPDRAVTSGLSESDTLSPSGRAVTTLYSTPSPAPAQGMVSITAEADGGTSTHITSIAVTPVNDTHIMYAGTNGGGVYKSTDSGRNWENISRSTLNPKAGQNWIDPYIKGNSAICVDPDDHNTVYVGTGYLGRGNLFRSLDGGMNWNSSNVEEWNGLYNSNTAVLTVLCDDDGSNIDDDGRTNYVWIGTEGQGILYADDGKNFAPSGGIINALPKDQIVSPKLGYSAESETWTLTCIVPDSTVTSPSIINLNQIGQIEIEYPEYTIIPKLNSTANPFPDGKMDKLTTSPSTKTEEWLVKYVVGTSADVVITSATKGSVVDIIPKRFDKEEVWTLTCINSDIDNPQLPNGTSAIFKVTGSISGTLNNATLNTTYSSEFITFKIVPSEIPFIVGDVIEFKTKPKIDKPYWQVSGSISGMHEKAAYNGEPYTSDNKEIGFTITEGTIPFVIGDYFTLTTYEARPSYWKVSGSKSGMQAGIAQTGQVYTSDNGQITFTIKEGSAAFKDGDEIIIDVIANKVGHGWTVWDIVKVPNTHRDTAVLYAGTATGVYKSTNGGRTWDSIGRFTGDYITCLELYHTPTFQILYAGTLNSGIWASTDDGRTWMQYPIQTADGNVEKGTNIKDILLDRYNKVLYAAAWYGPQASSSGKIFAHLLSPNLSMLPGAAWHEVNQGLTGMPIYAIAADNSALTTELYAGGDGINFYRASGAGINSAMPIWEESSIGLDNTIMARIPVLFSGEVSLYYEYTQYDGVAFLNVYLQDYNGNPPIAGSTFKVTRKTTDKTYNLTDVTYPDTYTYQGTFSDSSNGYTNYPYKYIAVSGDEVTLTYEPKCSTDAANQGAGCSGGGKEEIIITIP